MNFWELLTNWTIAVVAISPLLLAMRFWKKGAVAVVAATALVIVLGINYWPRKEGERVVDLTPTKVSKGGYISSDSCRSCHPAYYSSWHRTYHRTMTQLATPETVIAPFDNVMLQSRNRSYLLERRGDEFWVTMPDADQESWDQNVNGVNLLDAPPAPAISVRVVMTTGSHHMQGYWVTSRHGNQLRQLPWYYVIEDQRWVPREDVFLAPPFAFRHFKVWNSNCIKCHAVSGNPGLNPQQQLVSEVAELGIACEACHGPGEEHVKHHQNPVNRFRSRRDDEPDPTIVNPANCDPQVSSQVCGQCHSNFKAVDFDNVMLRGFGFRAGQDLAKSHAVTEFDLRKTGEEGEHVRNVYWNDGACRTGGDEYNGLMYSACFTKGKMSCLSCHSMHASDPNDQLAAGMETNDACLQCHEQYRDKLTAHTHHPADSSGSLCYNCHMPHTGYALFTAMRSHRIDIPEIVGSAKTNRPNACNLCHLDKTLLWSAKRLDEWFPKEKEFAFSEDEQKLSASLLWLLRGDAAQRVVTAWHMSWPPALEASGDDWQAPLLAHVLDDPYSAVRYVGGRSLLQLPGFEEFQYDFMGTLPQREIDKSRVLDLWHRDHKPTTAPIDPALGLTANGDAVRELVNRLISQRDNTFVEIPE